MWTRTRSSSARASEQAEYAGLAGAGIGTAPEWGGDASAGGAYSGPAAPYRRQSTHSAVGVQPAPPPAPGAYHQFHQLARFAPREQQPHRSSHAYAPEEGYHSQSLLYTAHAEHLKRYYSQQQQPHTPPPLSSPTEDSSYEDPSKFYAPPPPSDVRTGVYDTEPVAAVATPTVALPSQYAHGHGTGEPLKNTQKNSLGPAPKEDAEAEMVKSEKGGGKAPAPAASSSPAAAKEDEEVELERHTKRIRNEKERRDALKNSYNALRAVLPGDGSLTLNKAQTLYKSVAHIKELRSESAALKLELEEVRQEMEYRKSCLFPEDDS